MRSLLVVALFVVALFVVGCSGTSEYATTPDANPPETGSGVYQNSGTGGGRACGDLPFPVTGPDGGIAWEKRYVPCGEGRRNPISDPPIDDQESEIPLPQAPPDPRPDPPWDPTPGR